MAFVTERNRHLLTTANTTVNRTKYRPANKNHEIRENPLDSFYTPAIPVHKYERN